MWLVRFAVVTACLAPPAAVADVPRYNRDVRPILAENCFACHGPDAAARKAKLRLDEGGQAVERGVFDEADLAGSELLARLILPDDDESRMPPPSSHKQLTAEQKSILKRWVEAGAVYEPHWAFVAPSRPAVPAVKDGQWVRTPVDAFVLRELERRNLTPNPEADRRTLARRAALDVTGLPPTPGEVEAFVADTSPDAYEKYLDRLFARPEYGEHRARYWLDAARYADTHGIHFDNYREVWAYRDWVINSFNRNQPFDSFTLEQLAGDLLPEPTLDQLVATGFNRNNITTNEGGAINEEYLVLYNRERTDAASTVWMGLTAGCAVCHDHKFDPISQKEFYSLAAFFNNTTQAAMDGNVKDTPPVVFVPAQEDRAEWKSLKVKRAEVEAMLNSARVAAEPGHKAWLAAGPDSQSLLARAPGRQLAWLATQDAEMAAMPKRSPLGTTPPLFSPADRPVAFAGRGDFGADRPFSAALWFQVPKRGQYAALIAKMANGNTYRGWDIWLENDRLAVHLSDTWPDDAIKVVTQTAVNVNQWHHVAVTYDGSRTPGGIQIYLDGVPQPLRSVGRDRLDGDIGNDLPLTIGTRTNGQAFRELAVEDVRLDSVRWSAEGVERLASAGFAAGVLATPEGKRTASDRDRLFRAYLLHEDAGYRTLHADHKRLERREVEFRARGTVAAVMNEKPTPPEAFVLFRGEYDQRRERVTPGTPKALPPMDPAAPKNRLGLARWLLRPDHPLTARVTVNRLWQELFGNGLVATAGDFGITGEVPTHPELLDWLAVEFRTGTTPVPGLVTPSPWDVKRFLKLLMISSAYRQSSAATQVKLDADPGNRYLARGPRFRMDAEVVRDQALAAAGLLTKRIGGPSVRPYQPEGVWEAVAMKESNTGRYARDSGADLYRRSLYTFWKRAAPPASLEIFNAPNREDCTVRRDRTNTPLQALVTLNDPQFVEAARVLAQSLVKAHTTPNARFDALAVRLLARPFTDAENKVVADSLAALTAHYQANPEDAQKLLAVGEAPADPALDPVTIAAWTMLVNQLLNLDEVLCK